MKLLSTTPLLVAGAASVIAGLLILVDLPLAIPNVFEMGVGLATIIGLGGMFVRDTVRDCGT